METEGMIVKEMDPLTPSNPMEKAGIEAEKTMALYLKRAFADEQLVHVCNGVRFTMDGDAAQIDHLIVHPYGLIIVESKSVTTTISINEFGEWCRIYDGKKVGIPSPILQARRQGLFLQTLLNAHASQLMDTLYDRQQQPRSIKLDVLVAVSDSGIIERAPGQDLPELGKADQIPGKVKGILQSRCNAAGPHTLGLSPGELARISIFLIRMHTPLRGTAREAPLVVEVDPLDVTIEQPAPVRQSTPHECRHCHGRYLAVVYGKYGYYFKCLSCHGNTNISLYCSYCQAPGRLHKRNKDFYAVCQACGATCLYYTNIYSDNLANQSATRRQNTPPGCVIGLLGIFWQS